MKRLILNSVALALLAFPAAAGDVMIVYPLPANAPPGAEATGCDMNLWVDRGGYWNNRNCPGVVTSHRAEGTDVVDPDIPDDCNNAGVCEEPDDDPKPKPPRPKPRPPKPGHGHGDKNHDHEK